MYEQEEFNSVLGAVRRGQVDINSLPPEKKRPIANVILNEAARNDGGALAPALRRAGSLGPDFAAQLASGKIRLTETTKVFITKITSGSTELRFVDSGNVEKRGVRDIANTGLPAGKPFYLRAIRLTQVTSEGTVTAGDDTTKAEAAGLSFTYVDKVLSTGALTIKVGQVNVIERLGVSMFNNDGNTTVNPGYYELANPMWIEDQKPMEIFIDNCASLPAKTFARLELIGFDTYTKMS